MLIYCDHLISASSRNFNTYNSGDLPHTKAGLLLGTSKLVRDGSVNQYYQYRIEAAVRLFHSGKIDCIIVSGDNSTHTYDEPTDMKQSLIEQGIDSTKIFLDYAGFRTYDSVIRVNKIFQQDSVIIISQKFHNERAIYIAQRLHLTAYGYNAKEVNKFFGFRTNLREKFARIKVILDFLFGIKPRFLGAPVKI